MPENIGYAHLSEDWKQSYASAWKWAHQPENFSKRLPYSGNYPSNLYNLTPVQVLNRIVEINQYNGWDLKKEPFGGSVRDMTQEELNASVEQKTQVSVTSPMKTQIGGDHYKKLVIQPVEYVHKNGIGYMEGSAIKYLSRWRDKGGKADLLKAKHFIELLLEMEGD